jgi:hypothetical protein
MTRTRLNDVEQRLLGVLIEKQLTTPEGYPLSLNALRVGSNQKSNRDPLVEYGEAEVLVGVQGLEAKQLALRLRPGAGSRVEHYQHAVRERLGLENAEIAVLAELLLRGAQAPGELRQRASRMQALDTLASLSFVLDRLIAKGLVRRLPAGHGSRVERFQHTFAESGFEAPPPASVEEVLARHAGEAPAAAEPLARSAGAAAPAAASAPSAARPELERLRERVERLERQLAALAERLGERLED